jgi:hypothetical protein
MLGSGSLRLAPEYLDADMVGTRLKMRMELYTCALIA